MYEKCLKNLEDLNNNMNQDVHSLNNSKIQYTKLFSLMKASGVSNKDFEDLYIYIPPSFISEFNYWIVKPPDLFQGMGIKVFKDFKEIKNHCQNLFTGIEKVTAEQEDYCKKHNIELKPTIHKSEFILIQKYLDSPLLYYGRKFDIRCYVLVDYCFNVYMCREGHLKACSQKYDLNDLNIFTHITNYSLQKRCKDFAKYEQGNEISFKKFIELLDNTSKIKGRGKKIFNKIYSKMKEEIQISMNAVGRRLKGVPKVLSFQIFGYDFIIDKEYNPWILEINDNPGLEISSELISHLIPRMVDVNAMNGRMFLMTMSIVSRPAWKNLLTTAPTPLPRRTTNPCFFPSLAAAISALASSFVLGPLSATAAAAAGAAATSGTSPRTSIFDSLTPET
jgi:hypothetical protein